jgi:amino acid transporter
MVSGGPYGIEDILGGVGYAKALLILLLIPLVWTLPTSLMIGELASALPEDGGFYIWVRRAMGPFWGYQEAWLSLTASVFDMAIYPTLFTLYLGRLAPYLVSGRRAILWELAIVTGCCLWNLRGAPSVGRGSIGLFCLLLSPFAILTAVGIRRGWSLPGHGIPGHGLASHAIWTNWTAAPTTAGQGGLSLAILVAMWNYMGWDNASTVAREVEDPPATYPRAMLAAGALVALTYILPLAAMAYAGMPLERFTTGAWADAGGVLAGPHAGPWLPVAIVAGGALSSIGMFNALTLSYSRLPMVLAEEGMLPHWLAIRNQRHAPAAAILACGLAWALALGFSYERLISIDLILYGSSLILEFMALLILRIREPHLPRPFQMGTFPAALALSAMPIALVLYAIYASRTEHLAGIPAPLFGALTASAGIASYHASKHFAKK